MVFGVTIKAQWTCDDSPIHSINSSDAVDNQAKLTIRREVEESSEMA